MKSVIAWIRPNGTSDENAPTHSDSSIAVMDRLAEKSGSAEPAWPPVDEIDFVDLSQSLGVSATRLSDAVISSPVE